MSIRSRLTVSCSQGFAIARMAVGLLLTLGISNAAGVPASRPLLNPTVEYDALARLVSSGAGSELPCQIAFNKPSLGFDLHFHSDYHLSLPLKVVADAGGWLEAAIRVSPTLESVDPVYVVHRFLVPNVLPRNKDPVYVVHRFLVPNVLPRNKGEASLSGGFDLGSGRYRVDWLLRDARERVCAAHWYLEARPGMGLPLTLGPNQIFDRQSNMHIVTTPVEANLDPPPHVKILLNLSPSKPQDSIVRPGDVTALLSMLRGIVGQPAIALSSLVAFNVREQRILYREGAGQLDFAELKKVLQSPTAGTIDIKVLRDPQIETNFVTGLLTNHLGAQADPPDAIIIVGPKVTLDRSIPLEPLRAKGALACPVFYLNYNSDPTEPWTDTIGAALRAYKGASAHNITSPRDMGIAMRALLSRIVKRPNVGG